MKDKTLSKQRFIEKNKKARNILDFFIKIIYFLLLNEKMKVLEYI